MPILEALGEELSISDRRVQVPEALWASIRTDREALGAGSDGEDGMNAHGDGGEADDPLASLEHQPFRLEVEWMRRRLEGLLAADEAAAYSGRFMA